MSNKIVLGGIVAALILVGIRVRSLYNFIQKVNVTIGNPTSYKIIGGVFGKLQLTLPVVITNPTQTEITVSDILLTGYDKVTLLPIVSGSYSPNVLIRSQQNTTNPLTFLINIQDIINSLSAEGISRLMAGLAFGKDINLKVDYKANGIPMPQYTDTVTL